MAEYRTYLFSYRFDEKDWGFDIVASSEKEARERIKALAWAKYDGELVARVSAQFGFLARVLVWLRNWIWI